MWFTEDDVKFEHLTPAQFEELGFDLLRSLGYERLIWRRGAADSGRDIEAIWLVRNPLVGRFDERWFVECKRFRDGVPPEELNSKIAWADAERPQHLVFLVSSHLTNGAREWLDRIRPVKPYAIHVVEGKPLAQLVCQYSPLMERYFIGPHERLLLDIQQRWLMHGLLPDPPTLKTIYDNLSAERLALPEIAFLFCCAYMASSRIEEWLEESGATPFTFEHLFGRLRALANHEGPVLPEGQVDVVDSIAGTSDWAATYGRYFVATLTFGASENVTSALYCAVYDAEGEAIEILLERRVDLPTAVRHISQDSERELDAVRARLFARPQAGG